MAARSKRRWSWPTRALRWGADFNTVHFSETLLEAIRLARTAGAPLLMLACVSAFRLLALNPTWQKRICVLAPVGRADQLS